MCSYGYFDHPQAGRIDLDCDTFIDAGEDLRIVIYSAEPGSADAQRLELAVVLEALAAPGRGHRG